MLERSRAGRVVTAMDEKASRARVGLVAIGLLGLLGYASGQSRAVAGPSSSSGGATTAGAPPIQCPEWAPLLGKACVPRLVTTCPGGYTFVEGTGCVPLVTTCPACPACICNAGGPRPAAVRRTSCSAPARGTCAGCSMTCADGKEAVCTPGSWFNHDGIGWSCDKQAACRCE
jgi:hypothetical protein